MMTTTPKALTRAEILKAGNALCKKLNAKVESLGAPPRDPKSLVTYLQSTYDESEKAIAELEALQIPSEEKDNCSVRATAA